MTEEISDEELIELMQNQDEAGVVAPDTKIKDSVFRFFRQILTLPESTKVANFREEEIGKSRLPIRAYIDMANFANSMGYNRVAGYLMSKAEIISKTSMGRKGFLAQLFVTQIKKEQKITPTQQKHSWFGGNKEVQGEQQ